MHKISDKNGHLASFGSADKLTTAQIALKLHYIPHLTALSTACMCNLLCRITIVQCGAYKSCHTANASETSSEIHSSGIVSVFPFSARSVNFSFRILVFVSNMTGTERECSHCSVKTTPLWRKYTAPDGSVSLLCNACWVYAKRHVSE